MGPHSLSGSESFVDSSNWFSEDFTAFLIGTFKSSFFDYKSNKSTSDGLISWSDVTMIINTGGLSSTLRTDFEF